MGQPDSKEVCNMLGRPVQVHTNSTSLFQSHIHVETPQLKMGHLSEKLTKGWDILTAKIPLICLAYQYEYTHTLQVCFNRTHTRRNPST